jgi:hypothetical protein
VKVIAYVSAVSLLLGTLHGQVMRGPISPVCRVGVPCEAPAKQATVYFTRLGRTVSTVTDAKGYYRIRLAEGAYTVRTKRQAIGRGLEPRTVRVVSGRDKRVDFHIDTGIR